MHTSTQRVPLIEKTRQASLMPGMLALAHQQPGELHHEITSVLTSEHFFSTLLPLSPLPQYRPRSLIRQCELPRATTGRMNHLAFAAILQYGWPDKRERQQSLTSFFTSKTVNGAARTPLSQNQAPAEPGVHANSSLDVPRKRPLEEDTDNGNPTPTRKKSKSTLVERQETTLPKSPTKSSPVAAGPSRPNARTERYLYDGSSPRDGQPTAPGEDQQQGDAQDKKRKEELHRKFVQKLGRPDSMALMKRRNHQIDDVTQALNNEDGEDEEEDETPQPARAKKKGAKTGKLTPMEIQFLDIKRKHMDTLLIVEVGYKFKFFGEDARVAAKELSIVCIPGKFRYDEHPSEAPPRSVRFRKYSCPSAARPRETLSGCRPQSRGCAPDRDRSAEESGRQQERSFHKEAYQRLHKGNIH